MTANFRFCNSRVGLHGVERHAATRVVFPDAVHLWNIAVAERAVRGREENHNGRRLRPIVLAVNRALGIPQGKLRHGHHNSRYHHAPAFRSTRHKSQAHYFPRQTTIRTTNPFLVTESREDFVWAYPTSISPPTLGSSTLGGPPPGGVSVHLNLKRPFFSATKLSSFLNFVVFVGDPLTNSISSVPGSVHVNRHESPFAIF